MRASGVGVAEAAGVEADLCGRLCSGRTDCQPMNSAATAQRIIRSAKDGVTLNIRRVRTTAPGFLGSFVPPRHAGRFGPASWLTAYTAQAPGRCCLSVVRQ